MLYDPAEVFRALAHTTLRTVILHDRTYRFRSEVARNTAARCTQERESGKSGKSKELGNFTIFNERLFALDLESSDISDGAALALSRN